MNQKNKKTVLFKNINFKLKIRSNLIQNKLFRY